MKQTSHPLVERYLTRFAGELSDLSEREREEVVGEIRNHAAEAIRSGEEPAAVIESLGSAEQLGRAYRLELALEEPRRGVSGLTRTFTIIGLAAVSSLPSFVIVVTLGSLALGLVVGGGMATLLGVGSLVLPGTFVESTLNLPQPINELLAVIVGLFLMVGGTVAAVLLYYYVRTLARACRRVLADLRAT